MTCPLSVSAWTPLLLRALFVLIAAVVAWNVNGTMTPTRRGFHCGDPSIAFPYRRSTIPYWRMVEAQNCVLVALIILTEWLASRCDACGGGDQSVSCVADNAYGGGTIPRRRFIRPTIVRIVHWILLSAFGFALTIIVTELIKVKFGRLRPNFLDVCRPNITDCSRPDEYVFIGDALGRVPDADAYTLGKLLSKGRVVAVCLNEADGTLPTEFVDDARKSFISGHTSTVFYYAAFTMIYLHVRTDAVITRRFRRRFGGGGGGEPSAFFLLLPWRLCALSVHWTLLTTAALVGLSRITDNKHHAEDVLFGALAGSAMAATLVLYLRRVRTSRLGGDFSDVGAPLHATYGEGSKANGVAAVADAATRPTAITAHSVAVNSA